MINPVIANLASASTSMQLLAFTPAYAAFTFPLAISATAMFKVTEMLGTFTMDFPIRELFYHLAIVQMILSTVIILYVVFFL